MKKLYLIFVFLLMCVVNVLAGDSFFYVHNGNIYTMDLQSKQQKLFLDLEGDIVYFTVSNDRNFLACEVELSTSALCNVDDVTKKCESQKGIYSYNIKDKTLYKPYLVDDIQILFFTSSNRIVYKENNIIYSASAKDLSDKYIVTNMPCFRFDSKDNMYYSLTRSFKIIGKLERGKSINMDTQDYLFIKSMHSILYEDKNNFAVDIMPLNLSRDETILPFLKRYKQNIDNKPVVRYELWFLYLNNNNSAEMIYSDIDTSNTGFEVQHNIFKWSRDMHKIAFTTAYPYVTIINLDTGDVAKIAGENYQFTYDSSKVLYEKDGDIRICDADGRNSEVILKDARFPYLIRQI